jgi:hypothetical protein
VATDERTRGIRLSEEVRLAIDLVKAGLSELQRIDAANDQFHVPMLLLANGFERLMKAILCYRILHDEGRYPRRGEVPKTHDLSHLLGGVVEELFDDEYVTRPAIREDRAYLTQDPRLQNLIKALSDFGEAAGRYYNLDVVQGLDPLIPSPDEAWSGIEMAVLKEDEAWFEALGDPSQIEPTHQRIGRELLAAFERLARALARTFTLSRISPEAKVETGVIGDFLFLQDHEIGTTAY